MKTITKLYAVYDEEMEQYAPLYQSQTDAVAIRSFKEGIINKHPHLSSVIRLDRLGEFDTESGLIIPCKPVTIIKGSQCVTKAETPKMEVLENE